MDKIKDESFVLNPNYKPIVIHKTNRTPYMYHGGNTFENLHTGAFGDVADDLAKKIFYIPTQLNVMIEKYPNVVALIKLKQFKVFD